MAKATSKSAKATSKVSKATPKEAVVETKQVEVEAKSKAQINFEASLVRIKEKRSSGNSQIDELGCKILTLMYNKKLTFKETSEDLYEGTIGKANVTISKVAHGTKSTRIILNVAGQEIQGEFAARAFKMAHASLNKKGRASIQVDESKLNDVISLLDL
jgi:hypothetical protein